MTLSAQRHEFMTGKVNTMKARTLLAMAGAVGAVAVTGGVAMASGQGAPQPADSSVLEATELQGTSPVSDIATTANGSVSPAATANSSTTTTVTAQTATSTATATTAASTTSAASALTPVSAQSPVTPASPVSAQSPKSPVSAVTAVSPVSPQSAPSASSAA
ncbi:hypothetical protein CEP80_06285 [Jonesia denitrificans]|nr:hypothetical protein CEP80_06285 [Jonesia denitrificans]